MSQICLKGVSYAYSLGEERSLQALYNVSFSIEKGSFVALVGKNGSGKSTLAKLLNGLFLPSAGEVLIDGVSTLVDETAQKSTPTEGKKKDKKPDVNRIYEIRKKVGIVFQNPDNQTVATIIEDDVAFGPENLGLPREEIVARVDEALESVGMNEYRLRPVSKLSGGQKQRVAIAGVLAMRPEVIVFDESTSMLDPIGRKEIMNIAKQLNEQGITVINITHNMEEASVADRIIVLNKGRVVLDGTPKEVFAKDVSAYGLTLPLATESAKILAERGFVFDEVVLDENELVEGVCRQLN